MDYVCNSAVQAVISAASTPKKPRKIPDASKNPSSRREPDTFIKKLDEGIQVCAESMSTSSTSNDTNESQGQALAFNIGQQCILRLLVRLRALSSTPNMRLVVDSDD
jgi:hypothetical protein